MEYSIEDINQHKTLIINELFEWAETFDCETDEDGEKSIESYEYVYNLALRLENNECTKEDYEDINFHIYQINYNEMNIIVK